MVEHCPFKAGVLGSNPSRLTTPFFACPMREWIYKSATAMAAAIRSKEISAYELVRACLERIEEVNPRLNAVVQLSAERSLNDARDADQALARGKCAWPAARCALHAERRHRIRGLGLHRRHRGPRAVCPQVRTRWW